MSKTIKFLATSYALAPIVGAQDPKPVALELLNPSELLGIYNLVASNLGKGRVNRFSDKTAAVRRTWAVLEEYDAQPGEGTSTPTPSPAPTPTPTPTPTATGRKKRGMRFVFPAESEQKPIRPDSARGKALVVLSKKGGGTFEEVQEATGWNEKQAYEGIRLIHYYSGYGLAEEVRGGKTFISVHTGKK